MSGLRDVCIVLGSSQTHKQEAHRINPFLTKRSLETLSKLTPTVTLNQTTVSQNQTAIFKCKELKTLKWTSRLSPSPAEAHHRVGCPFVSPGLIYCSWALEVVAQIIRCFPLWWLELNSAYRTIRWFLVLWKQQDPVTLTAVTVTCMFSSVPFLIRAHLHT